MAWRALVMTWSVWSTRRSDPVRVRISITSTIASNPNSATGTATVRRKSRWKLRSFMGEALPLRTTSMISQLHVWLAVSDPSQPEQRCDRYARLLIDALAGLGPLPQPDNHAVQQK